MACNKMEPVACATEEHIPHIDKLERAIAAAEEQHAQAELVSFAKTLLSKLHAELEISRAVEGVPTVKLPIEEPPKDYWDIEHGGDVRRGAGGGSRDGSADDRLSAIVYATSGGFWAVLEAGGCSGGHDGWELLLSLDPSTCVLLSLGGFSKESQCARLFEAPPIRRIGAGSRKLQRPSTDLPRAPAPKACSAGRQERGGVWR